MIVRMPSSRGGGRERVRVRTLGLIELLFSYAISRRVFRERLRRRELVGVALLAVALVVA